MFRLEIATDNDAFEPNPRDEIQRILAGLGARLGNGSEPLEASGIIRDVNGNTVGQWQYTDEGE